MKGSVRKRNNKWYYSLDLPPVGGKRRRIERYGGETKKEALKTLHAAISELDTKGTIAKEINMSVQDYFEHWFKDYVMTNLKYNTQENYRRVLDNHIFPYLGNYNLKEVGPAQLQDLLNQEFQKGYAKKTLAIIKTVLTGSFKKAVYPYQFIKDNPMAYVEMPKYDLYDPNAEEKMFLTLNEFESIKNNAVPSEPFYIPFMIAFHTGMRRSEILGLEWKHVDFINNTLKVEQIMISKKRSDYYIGTPKTQSSYRTIEIGATLVNELKNHEERQSESKFFYGDRYENSDYICTKENGTVCTPNVLKYETEKNRKRSGVDFTFHMFRHTHASLLLEAGVSMKTIQERLGHSKISTTMDIYSHVTKKTRSEAVDLFENAIQKK